MANGAVIIDVRTPGEYNTSDAVGSKNIPLDAIGANLDELKKLNATEGLLASQKSEIDERIAWLEEQRGRYNELQQQLNLSEENYKYYRQRQEEARVNNLLNAQNITRIAVISQPSVPLEPAGPKKPLLMVAMIILGLCFTCAMALTMELMDDRLSFPAQIRARFGLPVLATFGKIERVQ